MNIIGEKIVLRAIEPDDNSMLLELINDPETEAMVGGSSWPLSFDRQMKWFSMLENSQSILRCIVATREDNKPIGTIILNEIDFKNGTAHLHIKMSKNGGRGKGYGTDAINTIVSYAFSELRLNCIFANIIDYNEVSVHLFEKCGFKRDGILRQRIFKKGNYHDVFTYSRLSSE